MEAQKVYGVPSFGSPFVTGVKVGALVPTFVWLQLANEELRDSYRSAPAADSRTPPKNPPKVYRWSYRILETHAHADHLTAASYLQARLSGTQTTKPAIGIGKRIGQVQTLFGHRYGVAEHEREGVFDKLFEDDEAFSIGNIQAIAIHLPGHTPDHLGYMIGDNVFCGDSLFHVDIGTARCDFPGGSASNLYRSGRRLLSLPGHVKIWTGHDYPPDGRTDPVPWTTVQDHRAHNKHLKDGIAEDEFVALRKARDANLGEPRLLHQSLQTNIRGGQLPEPTASGHRMLRVPLKLGGLSW
ncbi:Glyoxylase B2 [Colletotrichum sidae]|uniref:Glyoxylase B2 n=1 Tax=Colletotrichum sidae TaxID=1347389 RepID=A0A4V3I3Q4_9PEZI|nr:Glyoxylase B2 [Colletotrichum sidae]